MSILSKEKIRLNVRVGDKYDAIQMAGHLLVDAGHVPPAYVEAMIEREDASSTYLGVGLAMPHGTNEAKSLIKSTGMSILVLSEGVDFGGDEPVRLVIGLAAVGDEHMEVLSSVAMIVSEEEDMQRILNASSADELLRIFEEGMQG
jgi:mannitol PTS system EIIA component